MFCAPSSDIVGQNLYLGKMELLAVDCISCVQCVCAVQFATLLLQLLGLWVNSCVRIDVKVAALEYVAEAYEQNRAAIGFCRNLYDFASASRHFPLLTAPLS